MLKPVFSAPTTEADGPPWRSQPYPTRYQPYPNPTIPFLTLPYPDLVSKRPLTLSTIHTVEYNPVHTRQQALRNQIEGLTWCQFGHITTQLSALLTFFVIAAANFSAHLSSPRLFSKCLSQIFLGHTNGQHTGFMSQNAFINEF